MDERVASAKGLSLGTTWGAVAILVPAAVTAAVPTQALDLAYQLRAGAEMLASHHLMQTDSFTFTVHGEPWLNQQWGAQILLAASHPDQAWVGLGLLRVLALATTMLLVYRSCRAARIDARVAAALTVAGWFVGAVTMAQLRPQTFAMVLFSLTGWLVTTRSPRPGRLWLIPLITLAWVNIHGSFPLALVWLLLAAIDEVVGGRRADVIRIIAVAGASFVTMIANPYGVRVWGYVRSVATDQVVSERIGEWGVPSLRSLTGILFWASSLAVALVVIRYRARLTAGSFIGLASFGLLSVVAVRGVVWWALAAPVLLAPAFASRGRSSEIEASGRSPIGVVVVASLVVLTIWGVERGTSIDPGTGAPSMLTFAPGHLVDALRESQPPGSRVFASQVLASWAEYAADDYRYAVDSRIELFPGEVWDEYFVVSDGEEGWEGVLDRAGVDAALLDPSQSADLIPQIGADPDWRLVLRTEDGSLFVRV